MIKIIRWAAYRSFMAPFWTLMIIVLLCLPGNQIPGDGLFGLPHLDKIIHFFLFGWLVIFWGIRFWKTKTSELAWRKLLFFLLLCILGFGIGMEFVQRDYIPNRSFDFWDIVADAIGAIAGYGFLLGKGKSSKLLI